MDINALGIQHLNSAFVPFSAASMQAAGMPSTSMSPASNNDFSELLRRSQAARTVEGAANEADTSSGRTSRVPRVVRDEKLYELCLELETFLVKNLIKSMRSTVQKTNLIDTGLAGEIYEDMLYDEYAKDLTRHANFGLAEMAYRELSGTLHLPGRGF